jgi:hypothetical protein
MLPVGEVVTAYKERPQGSASKLRTYSDGFRILRTIMLLVQRERPLTFFGVAGLALLLAGLGFFLPVLSSTCGPGWCPGCRRPCCPPGWCCCRSCPSCAASSWTR